MMIGLQPKTTSLYVNTELTKWQQLGVEGHFYGDRPWSLIDEQVTQLSQELVGGKKDEVAILNTLSVNLHMLLLSFYKPHGIRNKILMENFAFCSDHHIIQSQLQYHGVDLNNIVYLKADEKGVKWEVIQSAIETHRDTLSLVFLPGIQFYSGEYFPMQQITALAHKYEIAVGFDLAHTAGNMPLHLHDWQVDFAAWCSYKYLNSGPGSIGGIYIHERHHERIQQEKMLAGWWGQDAAVRFQMKSSHQAARGAQCFKMSNPPVFSTVCLLASLEIFNKAKMKVLRNKSIVLTAYLEHLINTFLPLTSSHPTLPCTVSILTPPTLASRGCQLSLFFSCPVKQLHRAVVMRGVIGDIRQPNVIRLSPTPLYNTFTDVWYTIQTFKEEMEKINQAK